MVYLVMVLLEFTCCSEFGSRQGQSGGLLWTP